MAVLPIASIVATLSPWPQVGRAPVTDRTEALSARVGKREYEFN